tara:strand:+ start:367 stop:684 length:318 start_codon:yes stop_codon:yes gene_type:complete
MNDQVIQQDISKALGFEALNEAEQEVLADHIGELVLESALMKLMAGLTPEQTEALDHYLDDEPEPKILIQHLFEHYPDFENIMATEIENLKTDILQVFTEEEVVE